MEVSLLQYLRLDDAATLDRLVALKATCRRFGGDFTLLWHNDRLFYKEPVVPTKPHWQRKQLSEGGPG